MVVVAPGSHEMSIFGSGKDCLPRKADRDSVLLVLVTRSHMVRKIFGYKIGEFIQFGHFSTVKHAFGVNLKFNRVKVIQPT